MAISGKAGTGKTLLALASALHQHKQYEFIYLARPIVALSSKDLGYLPGDVNEKVDPYMQPLYDNLGFIKRRFNMHGAENRLIEELQKDQKLSFLPWPISGDGAYRMCILSWMRRKI